MQSPCKDDPWQLTGETLGHLLRALAPDELRAVERYRRLQGRLIFFFMRYRFAFPEDLADEAIDRLARKLADGCRIDNIEAFALGIARMVAREEHARVLREQRSHSEMQCNGSSADGTSYQSAEILDCIDTELDALPAGSRKLLMQYHDDRGINRIRVRQKLADELGISIGTLRKRVFDLHARLRLKLRQRIEDENPGDKQKERAHR